MPPTTVHFFQDDKGAVPVLDWLHKIPRGATAKGLDLILRLASTGYELRRPEVDYLRDGIYELRWSLEHVNYRILYFFHGRTATVLAHSLTKKDVIPKRDIELAIQRKRTYGQNPTRYGFTKEIE